MVQFQMLLLTLLSTLFFVYASQPQKSIVRAGQASVNALSAKESASETVQKVVKTVHHQLPKGLVEMLGTDQETVENFFNIFPEHRAYEPIIFRSEDNEYVHRITPKPVKPFSDLDPISYDLIHLIPLCKNPEVAKRLLEQSERCRYDGTEFVNLITSAIMGVLEKADYEIDPESDAHEIVSSLFWRISPRNISTYTWNPYLLWQDERIDYELGLFDQKSYQALEQQFSYQLVEITNDMIKMLKLRLLNFFNIQDYEDAILKMFRYPKFRVIDLKFLMEDRRIHFPLELRYCANQNWNMLVEALKLGRIDLALYLHQMGLRIPRKVHFDDDLLGRFAKAVARDRMPKELQELNDIVVGVAKPADGPCTSDGKTPFVVIEDDVLVLIAQYYQLAMADLYENSEIKL